MMSQIHGETNHLGCHIKIINVMIKMYTQLIHSRHRIKKVCMSQSQ